MGFDPDTGTFGFFYTDYVFYVMVGVGLIGGGLQYCTVAMTLKYFSALVVCSSFLF